MAGNEERHQVKKLGEEGGLRAPAFAYQFLVILNKYRNGNERERERKNEENKRPIKEKAEFPNSLSAPFCALVLVF